MPFDLPIFLAQVAEAAAQAAPSAAPAADVAAQAAAAPPAEPPESMLEICGYMLAGLGLFFTGLNLIASHLKRMTGRRLQEMFSRFAGHSFLAGWWGFVLGGVTQSDAAVAFLSMNLLRNRLLALRQAMVLMAWSSVGTSLLVFFTTLPMDTVVTYLLGVAGIAYAIEGEWKLRPLMGLLFGLGLIFFGLLLLEEHAGYMQDLPWFMDALEGVRGRYLLGFAVGALLTLLTQSSSAVSVVAIVLASSGILDIPSTLMIIYGTNVGSAAGLWLLASKERGAAKRLAMFEVMFNVVASAVLVPLFYVEKYGDVPLVMAGLAATQLHLKQQMAVAYLLFNLVGAVLVIPLYGWLTRWLEARYPEDAAEQAGRVEFLHHRATREPASCLGLIEQEQNRILLRLEDYFKDHPTDDARAAAAAVLRESGESLAAEIDPYLQDLLRMPLPADVAGKFARLVERQRMIEGINREYARIIPFIMKVAGEGDPLFTRLREGFEATTELVTDAVCNRQPGELEMAAAVTKDGGEAIRRLQEAFAEASAKGLSAAEQAHLLQATTGLERLIWLLHALTRNASALGTGHPPPKAKFA